jgi:hypothetical protein
MFNMAEIRYPGSERWERNEKEDLITAIGFLYEFKTKIHELHPNVTNVLADMFNRIHVGSN